MSHLMLDKVEPTCQMPSTQQAKINWRCCCEMVYLLVPQRPLKPHVTYYGVTTMIVGLILNIQTCHVGKYGVTTCQIMHRVSVSDTMQGRQMIIKGTDGCGHA